MSDDWHMLAEEERLFCDVLERICAERIAPKAAETDETSAFVHDQLAVLGEAGMMGANLPEEHGGSGISAPALLRAVAIVAGACGSTASAHSARAWGPARQGCARVRAPGADQVVGITTEVATMVYSSRAPVMPDGSSPASSAKWRACASDTVLRSNLPMMVISLPVESVGTKKL